MSEKLKFHCLKNEKSFQNEIKNQIKNYEDIKKEDLIISLLKLKESTAELFNDNNNNPYDNETSDVGRILNRLRDILPKKQKGN